MALAMARPWKHPKTGIYWLRKRVPDELRIIIGKLEEKRSLKTRDPAEAKVRHLQMLSEVEARWQNLRAGPKSISEREAHELAERVHQQWLEAYRDNPSEQVFWQTKLNSRLWAPPAAWDPSLSAYDNLQLGLDSESLRVTDMEDWCQRTADACLRARGLVVDSTSQRRMAKAIAAAVQRASIALEGLARGEFPDRPIGAQGGWVPPSSGKSQDVAPVKFTDLFAGWAAERQPAAKTIYEWKRVFRQLATFLGHDDARRLTAEDLIRWKGAMVAKGLRPKTIRDANITPVRAVLQWAADNRRLPANPADRITIELRHKAAEAKRSFSDEEAAIVLSAALRETDSVRRWVPWLCAYSGARLAEVCQLRAEDIIQIEGIWCMRFDPEAGSLKTRGSERAVPLHPAVIDGGFIDFAKGIGSGVLGDAWKLRVPRLEPWADALFQVSHDGCCYAVVDVLALRGCHCRAPSLPLMPGSDRLLGRSLRRTPCPLELMKLTGAVVVGWSLRWRRRLTFLRPPPPFPSSTASLPTAPSAAAWQRR